MTQGEPPDHSSAWRAWRASTDLDEYHTRWNRMASQGQAVHGEADAVTRLGATSVLDAGCGMGRVAVELNARGIETVGVDADDDMLRYARSASGAVEWVHADLATVQLGRAFDLVLLAGNVLLFARPGTEDAIVANLGRHLERGGSFIAGFQLGRSITIEDHDRWCEDAGLSAVDRWATWEGAPFEGGDYVVAVHQAR
ncbi:MAG: class I SAM-dependent methyltransferase [Actinomycetota bacterium]|nr:class I SAM-dependent methyltransferase [Actinomycetota bacterium]